MRGRGRERIRKLWDEDLTKIQLKKSRKRAVIISTILYFGFLIIVLRLADLMILDHRNLARRAYTQYLTVRTLHPQRGFIWDRRMREMAVNLEVDSLYAVPSKIEDVDYLSQRLSPIIEISADAIRDRLLKKKERDFIWLKRKIDQQTSHKLVKFKKIYGIDSIGLITETRRFYPKGHTASHILGFTDIDDRGLEGIELQYDEYLRGKVRKILNSRDARGRSLSSGFEEAIAGNNIILTIDETIQYIVEREIERAVEKWRAKAATAIMMNPVSGEILAMANTPFYDPNHPSRYPADYRRNRAITDIYEPGSTFKSILASAALEEGLVDVDEEFDVSRGYIVVGGKAIRDVHRHETLTFREVIQKSSNVGAVQIGLRLGKERYYEYMKRFGFGDRTGIDLPGEVRGILRRPERWSGTSIAALSIGQEIGVTPLQILTAYCAIANGGLLMRPYVVSEIISPQGEVIKRFTPQVIRRVISPETAETVRDILKTVVEEGGTGRRAYIKGNLVAGKTGTAQMVDPETGRYSRDRYASSFVGFVPADDPVIALIVVIYEPKGARYGGVVAAPVFRRIVEHTLTYLEVPMERNENHILLVSR
jgi:cell division protein FtsI (penicillin-binding protein 3)